jgi:ubiquinone/menaquinone biosynthesis C-methylase UbiE
VLASSLPYARSSTTEAVGSLAGASLPNERVQSSSAGAIDGGSRVIEFDESLLLALEDQRRAGVASPKAERYLTLLGGRPGERILDAGCGGGWLSRAVAPRVAPGGQVVGVDMSSRAVDLATRLADGEAPGLLSYKHADLHALPFAPASFDAVACISVLGFCDDPGRALSELRRVLRPGGRLLAASSDEETRIYNGRDRELGRRIMRAIADRGRDPWLGRRLAHLLEAAGFRIVQEQVHAEVERHFQPGAAGYIMAHACRKYLLGSGGITSDEYDRWLADLRACEWDGAYCYSVTTYAYVAERQPEDGGEDA